MKEFDEDDDLRGHGELELESQHGVEQAKPVVARAATRSPPSYASCCPEPELPAVAETAPTEKYERDATTASVASFSSFASAQAASEANKRARRANLQLLLNRVQWTSELAESTQSFQSGRIVASPLRALHGARARGSDGASGRNAGAAAPSALHLRYVLCIAYRSKGDSLGLVDTALAPSAMKVL